MTHYAPGLQAACWTQVQFGLTHLRKHWTGKLTRGPPSCRTTRRDDS